MNIDQPDLEEFVRLYEEEYGEQLSLDEARAMALRVIVLCERLMEPMPDELGTD